MCGWLSSQIQVDSHELLYKCIVKLYLMSIMIHFLNVYLTLCSSSVNFISMAIMKLKLMFLQMLNKNFIKHFFGMSIVKQLCFKVHLTVN